MDEPEKHVSRLAALQAYEIAGLGPEDMDVEGACHAIQENGGGLQGVEEAAVAIHILSR